MRKSSDILRLIVEKLHAENIPVSTGTENSASVIEVLTRLQYRQEKPKGK